MRLAYRWAHLAIRRLDLGQRYLKGSVRYSSLALLLVLPLLLTGCATPKNAGSSSLSPPPLSDPLEPVNRMVFGFNDGLDRFFIRPVAVVYLLGKKSGEKEGFDYTARMKKDYLFVEE